MSAAAGERARDLPVPLDAVGDAGGDITEASREVLRTHARSFSWGALFLPRDARDDAALLYAWCRHVDDLVDEATDLRDAEAALDQTQRMLRQQAEPDPLTGAFLDMARRRALPLRAASELVAGMQTDLHDVRMKDDAELLLYGYRAAGTVGLLMCGILGVTDEKALPFAVDLGIAMQLTNICRDVREDALRGRVYLPGTRLRAHGTSADALLHGNADPDAVARTVRELLALAERYYDSGHAGMHFIPARTRLAIRVAAHVYREIGRRLLARGADPLAGRTVVPGWRKAVVTSGAVLQELTTRTRTSGHHAPLHQLLPELPGVHGPATQP